MERNLLGSRRLHAGMRANEVAGANDIDELELQRARKQRLTGPKHDRRELHPHFIEQPSIRELSGKIPTAHHPDILAVRGAFDSLEEVSRAPLHEPNIRPVRYR